MQLTSLLYLTVPNAAMPPYGVVLLAISVFNWQHQWEPMEIQWLWASMGITMPGTDILRGRVGNAWGNSLASNILSHYFQAPNFCLWDSPAGSCLLSFENCRMKFPHAQLGIKQAMCSLAEKEMCKTKCSLHSVFSSQASYLFVENTMQWVWKLSSVVLESLSKYIGSFYQILVWFFLVEHSWNI